MPPWIYGPQSAFGVEGNVEVWTRNDEPGNLAINVLLPDAAQQVSFAIKAQDDAVARIGHVGLVGIHHDRC